MQNICDSLEERLATTPDLSSFNFIENDNSLTSVTYHQLFQKIATISNRLNEENIKNERVLLLLPPNEDFIASLFACFMTGAIAIPAFPPLNEEMAKRILLIIKNANVKYVLANRDLVQAIKYSKYLSMLLKISSFLGIKANKKEKIIHAASSVSYLNIICIDELEEYETTLIKRHSIKENDVAYLQYTSGSTSEPKGVMVTHKNIINNIMQIQKLFNVTDKMIYVNWLPLYHDMGLISEVFMPILAAMRCYLLTPLQFLKRPACLLENISKYKATGTGGPDFSLRLITSKIHQLKEEIDLSSLEIFYIGSEKVNAISIAEFNKTFSKYGLKKDIFLPCYGLAECTLLVSGKQAAINELVYYFDKEKLKKHIVETSDANANDNISLVSAGTPSSFTQVKIICTKTGRELKDNEVGEICVASDSVTPGYWNNKELNQNLFINFGDTRYLKTGDLGFLHQGELFIAGRLKELIIIAGKNHYPQDIERNIVGVHNELKLGKIVAFSTEKNFQEALIIAAEIKQDFLESMDANELINKIRQVVAKAHLLHVEEVLFTKPSSLPKTSSGKLKRIECKDLYEQSKLSILHKG